MEDRFYLNKIIYQFSQDTNSDGTTGGRDDEESLIVEVEGAVGSIDKEGGYLVLRTSTGWSINDSSEMQKLLDLVQDGVPLKKNIKMEEYIVVTWPDIQYLMDKEEFEENSALINSEFSENKYGQSAYFVNKEWLEAIDEREKYYQCK